MEQVVSWREHFKISGGQSDGQKPELCDVLLNGLISEADYFKWAKEAYQLPLVNESFFAIPEDPIYWESICHAYKWDRNLFPLTEWDGTVLIGCLEPPADFRFRREHRFVLVPPNHLHALWQKLNPKDLYTASMEVPQQTAAAVPLEATVKEQPKITIEGPAGLSLDLSKEASPVALPEEVAIEPAPPMEMPEGMLAIGDLDLKIPSAPLSASEQTPAPLHVVPPPMPPPAQAAPAKEAAPSKVVSQNGELRPIASCETLEEISAQALNHVLKHFKSAMVLIHEKDGFVPWQWTAGFASPANANAEPIIISKTEASIFCIVARTRLPFHGGVRPSPENNRVFAAFGDGKLPAHASVVPVIVEGHVSGMLMGISDGPMDHRFILPPLERLASEVGVQVLKFRSQKAA